MIEILDTNDALAVRSKEEQRPRSLQEMMINTRRSEEEYREACPTFVHPAQSDHRGRLGRTTAVLHDSERNGLFVRVETC